MSVDAIDACRFIAALFIRRLPLIVALMPRRCLAQILMPPVLHLSVIDAAIIVIFITPRCRHSAGFAYAVDYAVT